MYTVNYYHRTTQLLMLIVFSVAFRRELLPSVEPHDKIIKLGGGRGNNKYRHVYNIRKKIKRRSKIGRSVSDFIQLFVEVSVRVHILYAERVINYTRNRFRVKYTLGEHRTHIIIIILCACTHYIYIFILHVLCGYSAYLRERCTCSAGKV